jgi:uroporphyrinogen decarboxylase
VKDESDMKNLTVPDPDADYRFDSIRNAMKIFDGEKAIIIRLRDVFSQPRDLMGFENFMISFYTQPELVEELMEISVDYNTRLAKNARELGGEIIVVGDDLANNSGLLISPEQYRRMVLPHFKKLIQSFKRLGFYVIKHTDGNIMAVLDDLIDTGIDCIDPIDPLGHMDIAYIKNHYGSRVCLKGNVDCVRTLVDKTPEEVARETKDCILKASIGGGHIISSSNSIHSGINPENYRVFLETVREYGTYPLDLEKLKA